MRPTERFHLSLTGPFRLEGPNGRIEVSSRKGMALLAMLGTAPDGERTRAWLQDKLWGSRGEAQAQASLRRELANLRMVFKSVGDELPLSAGRDRVRLDFARVAVNVREPLGVAIVEGVALGEFLEGIDLPGEDGFEEWLRTQRRHFAEQPSGNGAGPRAPAHLDAARGPLAKVAVAALPLAIVDDGQSAEELRAVIDEIRFALARVPSLSILEPEPGDDPIARSLSAGAAYALSGQVRRHGSGLRVGLILTDCRSRRQLWADTFEPDAGLGAAQLASMTASRVESAIERAEMARVESRGTAGDPLGLLFQADALFRKWDKDSLGAAIELAARVLTAEPRNAWATGLSAFCHGALYAARWTDDMAGTHAKAMRMYSQAIRDGGDDPLVLGYCAGTLISLGGDLEIADQHIVHGIELRPDAGPLLFWGGWVDLARGDVARGLARFETLLQLNPHSNARAFTLTGLGLCLAGLGRFRESAPALSEAAHRIPDYAPTIAGLALALAKLERREESRRWLERLPKGGIDHVLDILQAGAVPALLRELKAELAPARRQTAALN